MAATDAMHLVTEGEPELEARLVALTSRDIDDAKRLLETLSESDRPRSSRPPTAAELVCVASRMLSDRRRRIERFGRAMFGEFAWEILLLLYVTQDAQRHTVSRLPALSGGPRSTATRWIEYLEKEQLVQKVLHPTDQRIALIELTDKGLEALSAYLTETLAANG